MAQTALRFASRAVLCAAALAISAGSVAAQVIRAPLTDGFARSSSIEMSVDEMLGPRKARLPDEPILGPGYPDLRIAEIQFKPVRLMRMAVTDPATGRTENEIVWYMAYRVIPRDYTEIAGDGRDELLNKLSDPETDPRNELDQQRANPIRLPRFILVVEDEGSTASYMDEVNLQIQQAVFRREFSRRAPELNLVNRVGGIAEMLESNIVPSSDPDPLEKAVYGVAVWRNVDPQIDFFSVYMSGFCNAYRISTSEGGETVVEEKVVRQKFARPGDEFLQEEQEFRLIDTEDVDGDGAPDLRFPRWEYRPRPATIEVPQFETVLRNTRAAAPTADQ